MSAAIASLTFFAPLREAIALFDAHLQQPATRGYVLLVVCAQQLLHLAFSH